MRYIGTVMTKELNSVARRRRTFVLRIVLPSFLLLTVFLFIQSINDMNYRTSGIMGRSMFYTLVFMVMGAGFFMAPAYTAPLICSEREQQTLEIITSTPIKHYELVVGKIGSRVVLLVLLSLAAVPLMFVCLMFGGVSLREILLASAFIVCNILICSGAGILFSSLAVKSSQAISRTYSILVLMGLASMILSRIFPYYAFGGGGITPYPLILSIISFILVTMNPFAMLLLLSASSLFGGGIPTWFWFCAMGESLGFFIISIFLASFVLKRTTYWEKGSFFRVLLMGDKSIRKVGKKRGVTQRKPVKFNLNPVYRKECLESFLSRPSSSFGASVMVLGIFILLYFITLFLWPSLWFENASGHYYRASDRMLPHIALILGEFALAFFSLTSAAANTIVKERSRKTLDALLTTPLSSISIWLGKFFGVWRRGLPIFVVPFLHIALCIFHGISEVHTLLLMFLTAIVVFTFFIVVGLSSSIKFRKRTGAVTSTLGVAFFVFILIPMFTGMISSLMLDHRSDDFSEVMISLSPWYWVVTPMYDNGLKEFFDFGIGYFWFLMVYGIIAAILASIYAKTLRERVSGKE